MDGKKQNRLRRARKARAKIRELNLARLCVYKSNKYLYAQIIETSEQGDKVVASASTAQLGGGKNIKGAVNVGNALATQAKQKGIVRIAFDRSGYQYHGKVRQIAEAAREGGLQF